jgi:hypothetical protein
MVIIGELKNLSLLSGEHSYGDPNGGLVRSACFPLGKQLNISKEDP